MKRATFETRVNTAKQDVFIVASPISENETEYYFIIRIGGVRLVSDCYTVRGNLLDTFEVARTHIQRLDAITNPTGGNDETHHS
jgi:hypothetical protein